MQQIIYFFIRNKNFLLFALLFALSVALTINAHSYHKNKYIGSANAVAGKVYTARNNVQSYFGLDDENELLVKENLRLREIIEGLKAETGFKAIDTTSFDSLIRASVFKFIPAKVINNSYSKSKNNLTLNQGLNDGIENDMGVVTASGIVGIVNSTSARFATVQSILNTQSKINVKLKKSSHFGTLIWNTKNPNIVQIVDIPRLAPLKMGDTIVTGGKSTIFPEGLLVGTLIDFSSDKDDNYYLVNVKLFNDMTSLSHVYMVKNKESEEIILLEKSVEDEQ